MPQTELVFLTEDEYSELLRARELLVCLEEAGVKNWDGYPNARQLFEAGEFSMDGV